MRCVDVLEFLECWTPFYEDVPPGTAGPCVADRVSFARTGAKNGCAIASFAVSRSCLQVRGAVIIYVKSLPDGRIAEAYPKSQLLRWRQISDFPR